jgi:hypothetical protein
MLAPDIVLTNGEYNMNLERKLDQGIEKGPARMGVPSEGEEEQRTLLDLRIGLALLGGEGRRQLLQYMRTLCKRDEEKASARGRTPSS